MIISSMLSRPFFFHAPFLLLLLFFFFSFPSFLSFSDWKGLHKTLSVGDSHSLATVPSSVELDKLVSVLVQESMATLLSTVIEEITKVPLVSIFFIYLQSSSAYLSM